MFGKNLGYTRREIAEQFKDVSGSELNKILSSLEESDYVIRYIPFADGKREEKYRLSDPYCLMYLYFIKGQKKRDSFWQFNVNSSILNSWKGFPKKGCEEHSYNNLWIKKKSL